MAINGVLFDYKANAAKLLRTVFEFIYIQYITVGKCSVQETPHKHSIIILNLY